MKKALITGITGQDGSYLSEFLLAKGYEIHGIVRRSSNFNTDRIDHLYQDPHESDVRMLLHYGDLSDSTSIHKVLEKVQPDEVYNLGAQSHVKVSFEKPVYTADVVAKGALHVLETFREYAKSSGKQPRFYQAGSSEMYGSSPPPQNENTSFHPRSPYAVSKVAAHWYARNYRESYDLFICNGILFNHESPRRGKTFVTRKITRALGRIKLGLQDTLYLGNLDAMRDWGYAKDYVAAMWQMLQQPEPEDYVLATGESHSVKEFLEEAAALLDIDWEKHIKIDQRYFRPTEVDHLLGDASKARQKLGWEPKVTFKELVKLMVEHDLELARQERTLRDAGHKITQRGAANG